ncbi:MAG: TonB-dependent receptor [Woeseia sp.]|nr:TonB-dependent receptor [Woeseia sp.]NNE59927.1 TonB-dependent receptor [Woeseia sp.]NNL53957.1 TonB-dependent receptor [Woeseia sp.]
MRILTSLGLTVILAALSLASFPAVAQDENRTAQILLEEIIVTGTKRAGGIEVQDAPVAISAYNESQLDAMHLRDLQGIGYSAPSVQLEDIGTSRGTANFSIRGLGINSSIPSIDPTVGVFVDGVYLGINAGVVLDIFDLEGIEVLRGPQGLLFGKNVTGGAVLLRSSRPTEDFRFKGKLATETGDNRYLSAVVSGPLNDQWRGKFAAYYNDDGGWHTNLATGADHGKAETSMFRGALEWTPTDASGYLLSVETGSSDGDGPASQNEGLYGTDNFDFSIDEPGFYDNTWNQLTLEASYDVAFGDGEIINILGYRDYESRTLGDIDASPFFIFHAPARIDQDQLSNELRYAGSFDNIYVTTGLYYFEQDLLYLERRIIQGGALDITGGGNQQSDTLALFGSVDIAYGDNYTLNLGARFTREEKDAQIATILFNLCTIDGGCAAVDFKDSRKSTNFAPKVGLQIRPDDDTLIYGFWTKGFRSGGYNMRHTAAAIPNQGFDDEEQDSFEIGMKRDFADGRVRINAAVYHNKINDMQREVNLSDPVVGVVQLIRNTADATISGIDLEGTFVLSDSLLLTANFGQVSGRYDRVGFDLNGDGVVDNADKELKLPRLAPRSYGAQLVYTRDFNWGGLTVQGSGYRRDPAPYTDNNLGSLRAADMFGARISADLMDGRLSLSAFGKNLKDESTIGGDTQLPPNFAGGPAFAVPSLRGPGATFSPLNKGRIYGFEVIYSVE